MPKKVDPTATPVTVSDENGEGNQTLGGTQTPFQEKDFEQKFPPPKKPDR